MKSINDLLPPSFCSSSSSLLSYNLGFKKFTKKDKCGADLSGEWKLWGFSFAGSVNGCQWRRPGLSHFLERWEKLQMSCKVWVTAGFLTLNTQEKLPQGEECIHTFRISSTQLASPDPWRQEHQIQQMVINNMMQQVTAIASSLGKM